MKGKKRLVLIVPDLGIGGAEAQVMRLAMGTAARGWRVSVVSLLEEPSTLKEPLESAGIDVRSLHMNLSVPGSARAILRLRKVLRELRPDVVHSHTALANQVARLTRLITRIPTMVSSAHNVQEGGWAGLKEAYRVTDWLADLTTNVSRIAVQHYIHIGAAPADRIRFMPNGVDVNQYNRNAEARVKLGGELNLGDDFVWLAAGGFRLQKDYPNMVRAFASLIKNSARPAILMIAGAGECEQEAKDLAQSLGIRDRVRFLGERTDVAELMGMADAFVLSSAWEGMPLVLQEASASSLPIVATDVGGVSEVALDDISAFLVPPRDSAALANAMRRMMELPPDGLAAMGEAGRTHVEQHYAMDQVLDRWEATYAEFSRKDKRSAGGTIAEFWRRALRFRRRLAGPPSTL